MKILLTTIVLTITLTTSVFGQTTGNELPDKFIGDWVETLNQCEISPILSISKEDTQLIVYGYEWSASEVRVIKSDEYYTLLMISSSEGEEYESELNIKMGNDGNIIVVNAPTEETKMIRCK
ncbi:MAG: hypothetical protein ACI85Q_000773 [Salibacteraceae bacterium]|jgi:hypothetical protein